MVKEGLKGLPKFESLSPSEEFLRYIDSAWSGTNRDIPTYGQGKKGIFDYYGRNEQGNEQARFRIPWGKHEKIEKSYHIERKTNGEFIVTAEGFYPYKK